jgi:hypothetical protein
MAGNPPPNFGGNRQFIADPLTTGLSTSVGDAAANQLQMLHLLRAVLPDGMAGNQALFDQIAAQSRQILEASNASQTREQSTRELRPITRVPLVAWGATVNIAPIRTHHVPVFTGSGTDANGLTVNQWLTRIFNLARNNTLTFEAAISLMVQQSGGGATDYIEQMRDEGKTLHQIVQQLEMRYGELCTPEEARVRCNSMLRKDKEILPDFVSRLRSMCQMATRMETDDIIRRAAIESLVEANIRRVLPTSVRNALEERIMNRSRMGLPALDAREIERECFDLEKRRDERKQGQAVVQAKRHIRQLQYIEPPVLNSSDDDSSSEEEADPEEVAMEGLVNEIRQQEKRYINKGRPINPQKVYRKAFQKYNEKRQQARAPQKVVRQAQDFQPRPSGPPQRLEVRKPIMELLDLAHCVKGQCIQCGMDGHMMNDKLCALKDKFLVDRACSKCGKGLHSADDCMRVFQKYGGNQPPAQGSPLVQLAQQDDSLKEQ